MDILHKTYEIYLILPILNSPSFSLFLIPMPSPHIIYVHLERIFKFLSEVRVGMKEGIVRDEAVELGKNWIGRTCKHIKDLISQ